MTPRLGLIRGEGVTEYHATDAFSNSKLKDFERLPALYQGRYITRTIPRRPQTKALSIGSAIDTLLLEGTPAYHLRCVVTPDTYTNKKGETKPWHNGAEFCADWCERAEAAGKVILSPADATQVESMAAAAYADPDIAALLENGEPAVTWRADFGFAVGQCRTDWYNPEGCILPSTGKHTGPYFIELKSCRSLISLDYGSFEKDFANMGYHRQVSFYREVIRQVQIDSGAPRDTPFLRCFVIAVDKTELVLAQASEPSERLLALSHPAVEKTLERLAECYETNRWPGLPTGVRSLDLPEWEAKRLAGT